MSNYNDFSPVDTDISSGTYTIRLTDENNSNNIVTGSSLGSWAKNGNIILVHGRVDIKSSALTSNAWIKLPFDSGGTGVSYSVGYGWDCGSDYSGSGWFLFQSGNPGMARIDNNVHGSLSLAQISGEALIFRFSLCYTTS